jgi:hypothetical protein
MNPNPNAGFIIAGDDAPFVYQVAISIEEAHALLQMAKDNNNTAPEQIREAIQAAIECWLLFKPEYRPLLES